MSCEVNHSNLLITYEEVLAITNYIYFNTPFPFSASLTSIKTTRFCSILHYLMIRERVVHILQHITLIAIFRACQAARHAAACFFIE